MESTLAPRKEYMNKLVVGADTIYADSEHLVLDVTAEGSLINFTRQIDDLLIATPDGDVLLSWTVTHETQDFPENECILVSARDNLKEIGNLKTTLLAIRPREDKTLKVYLTAQRN